MNYERKYKDALERARKIENGEPLDLPDGTSIPVAIFPELKESEDERIRKQIISFLKEFEYDHYRCLDFSSWIAWLEKQCGHAKFIKGIQVGDKVTRNEDGVLVNLSQLNRVAKKEEKQGEKTSDKIVEKARTEKQRVLLTETDGSANIVWDTRSLQDVKMLLEYGLKYINCELEKQGEQKPIDAVEPKFKVGDWVVFNNKHQSIYQIEKIEDGYYILRHTHGGTFRICVLHDDSLRLWTIQDAKDGDVLANAKSVFIYVKVLYNKPYAHCGVDKFGVFKDNCLKYDWSNSVDNIHPATKEQRDLLFQKMKEAGYGWDANKKELIKL